MMPAYYKPKQIVFLSVCILVVSFFLFILPKAFSEHYILEKNSIIKTEPGNYLPKDFVPTYVSTPPVVKGIYMTSWTAGSDNLRQNLLELIEQTELNTVVIDIKDYSGAIVFPVDSALLKDFGSEEVRVSDMPEFINTLHKKGIYVIGRIAVFQDAYFVNYRPDLAVKNKAGTEIWKDHKGISWIDPSSREYWDYIILIAKEARSIGFDEINFDYIRFPSDGNMDDISYPWSSTTPKSLVVKSFFEYIGRSLKDLSSSQKKSSTVLKISADLFGMTTTAQNDMGIGQILEDALPHFDYISPMVYPSHYPPDFEGFKEPEEHPYEVVYHSMKEAVRRTNIASSSPEKLRPWLQDFGLKMNYGPDEVRAQIKATNDTGLSSWLLWSASNKYTKSALITEQ